MVKENSLHSFLQEESEGRFGKRNKEVFELIVKKEGLTSREIMIELGYSELNNVRPRLTELLKGSRIKEGNKVKCQYTNKSVTTYYIK